MNENDEWKQPKYDLDDDDQARLGAGGIPWLPIALALMLVGVFLIMANASEQSTSGIKDIVPTKDRLYCSISEAIANDNVCVSRETITK